MAIALIVAGFVLLASGIGIGWTIGKPSTPSRSSGAIGNPAPKGPIAAPRNGGSGRPLPGGGVVSGIDVPAVATKVDPAVVDINTVIAAGVGGSNGGTAAGTGMILTSTGEVLTNNHVIRGATQIRVTIQGRSGTFAADVIGADPAADVALIKISNVSGLPTVSFGDASKLRVGQPIAAIGNAFGRGGVPSANGGTITALNQTITAADPGSQSEPLSGLILSNAPIAPGDSGGPLVDATGKVVGMTTAASRRSPVQQVSTRGYAIAVGGALDIVRQIRTGQATADIILGRPGLLGVEVQDLNSADAAQLGLSISQGALVIGVMPGTPAAGTALSPGSVITRIDSQAITSASGLGTVLHMRKPGQSVKVTWVSASGSHTAIVQLVTGPAV
jgi:S1-C subfamily serine protease